MTVLQFLAGQGFFSLPLSPDQLLGPFSLLSKGYGEGAVSLGIKQAGHEADHAHPPSAKDKNT
jgi:hypothetical protein